MPNRWAVEISVLLLLIVDFPVSGLQYPEQPHRVHPLLGENVGDHVLGGHPADVGDLPVLQSLFD